MPFSDDSSESSDASSAAPLPSSPVKASIAPQRRKCYTEYLWELLDANAWRAEMIEHLEALPQELKDEVFDYLAVAIMPEFTAVSDTLPDNARWDLGPPLVVESLDDLTRRVLHSLADIKLLPPYNKDASSANDTISTPWPEFGSLGDHGIIYNCAHLNSALKDQVTKGIAKSIKALHPAEFPNYTKADRMPLPLCLRTYSRDIIDLHLTITVPVHNAYPVQLYQAQKGLPDLLKYVPKLKFLKVEIAETGSKNHIPQYLAQLGRRTPEKPHTTLQEELGPLVKAMRALNGLKERKIVCIGIAYRSERHSLYERYSLDARELDMNGAVKMIMDNQGDQVTF